MECCVMDPGGARFERDDFRLLAGSLVLPIPAFVSAAAMLWSDK